jgi:prepilin-type processing-associated H-X9-DG protein
MMGAEAGVAIPYFYQTHLWAFAIATSSQESVLGATCPSADKTRQVIRPPEGGSMSAGIASTYRVSAAFYATPTYWRPDVVHQESMFIAQPFHRVRFPAKKSVLYEHNVLHAGHGDVDALSLPTNAAPVAFVDGHCEVARFEQSIRSIRVVHDSQSPFPYSHTTNGVFGLD